MSDREFLEYNVDNIFKNLLQAEYHAKNIVDDQVPPEHISCINKHLAFVEAEAEEATAHCVVGEPELCDFFKSFMVKVRALRNMIKRGETGRDLQHRIRLLRKEIESKFSQYDTSKCQVCKITLVDLTKKKTEEKGGQKMAKISDTLEKELRDMMGSNPAGLSVVLKILEEECYEISSHLEANWQDRYMARWWSRIGRRLGVLAAEVEDELGDPVSPEEIKQIEKKGFEIHGHPICILSKMAEKGISREQAEKECLKEGKVHPISFWAAKYRAKLMS